MPLHQSMRTHRRRRQGRRLIVLAGRRAPFNRNAKSLQTLAARWNEIVEAEKKGTMPAQTARRHRRDLRQIAFALIRAFPENKPSVVLGPLGKRFRTGLSVRRRPSRGLILPEDKIVVPSADIVVLKKSGKDKKPAKETIVPASGSDAQAPQKPKKLII